MIINMMTFLYTKLDANIYSILIIMALATESILSSKNILYCGGTQGNLTHKKRDAQLPCNISMLWGRALVCRGIGNNS
jgi:hypothetical protein